jgi:hypothetical protein
MLSTTNLRLLKRDVHFLMETNELVMKMKKASKKQTDNNLISFSKLNCEWNSKVEDINFSWNGIFLFVMRLFAKILPFKMTMTMSLLTHFTLDWTPFGDQQKRYRQNI